MPLRVEPVDQALHLRHHFGADAVAGEKQQFMGRHGRICLVLRKSRWMRRRSANRRADCNGVRNGKTPLPRHACAIACGPATMHFLPENPVQPPTVPAAAHPARLILILSLAPTVGLGIGRFAYSLVLPDMRDTLGWSYSAAGFMNTDQCRRLSCWRFGRPRAHQALRAVRLRALGNAGLRACRWRCAPSRAISSC